MAEPEPMAKPIGIIRRSARAETNGIPSLVTNHPRPATSAVSISPKCPIALRGFIRIHSRTRKEPHRHEELQHHARDEPDRRIGIRHSPPSQALSTKVLMARCSQKSAAISQFRPVGIDLSAELGSLS
jgi:hypothetical protein